MNQLKENLIACIAFLAVALPLLVTLFFILKLARYSRRIKMNVEGAMLGLVGRAESAINGDGMVFVRGELWHAHARAHIPSGARVRITGFKQLALEVEAVEDERPETASVFSRL